MLTLTPDATRVQQLVHAMIEAWNSHDPDRFAAFFAPDFEGSDVGDPTQQSGQDAIRQSMARYLSGFPDLRISVEEVIAQGERAVVAWEARGTHSGTLMHIPPTDRAVQVRGASFLTIRDGQIVHARHIWDMAGLLRALGLLPDL